MPPTFSSLESKEPGCSILQDTEEFLSKLVVSKTIYARIDRPAGVVSFQVKKDANQILNGWSNDINTLLNLVEKTCHLISKEVSCGA